MSGTVRWSTAMLVGSIAVSLAVAAPGAAGYDPKADAAADLEAAKTRAASEGKRILVEVGGDWCVWCHRLERFLHERPEIDRALDEGFVVVKVNYSDDNENEAFLARFPKIAGYPHVFVLAADGTLLHSQDTGELEDGGKSYDAGRVLRFLEEWAPRAER